MVTPNAAGRTLIGVGTVPNDGASPRTIVCADSIGNGRVTLTTNDIAAHVHMEQCYGIGLGGGDATGAPSNYVFGGSALAGFGGNSLGDTGVDTGVNLPDATTLSNGHENLPPAKGVFFIIRTARIWHW
jgi:hypothetical protein